MEYREPSRIAASERRPEGMIEDAASPARQRRFEFVRPTGRLDVRCRFDVVAIDGIGTGRMTVRVIEGAFGGAGE